VRVQPIRYLISLAIPLAGTVGTMVDLADFYSLYTTMLANMSEANSLLAFGEDQVTTAASSVLSTVLQGGQVVLIYGACIASAFAHERHHRSLFTVHLVRNRGCVCGCVACVRS
jgi:hypothetical protein